MTALLISAVLLLIFLFSGAATWCEDQFKGGMVVAVFGITGAVFASVRIAEGTPLAIGDLWGFLFLSILFVYHFGKSREWNLLVERRVPGAWDALACVAMLALIVVGRIGTPLPWRPVGDTVSVGLLVALAAWSLWEGRRKRAKETV